MMESMKRNYQDISRERERSRDKRKREDVKVKEDEDDHDHEDQTLSECEDCIETLRTLDIAQHPKLQKYLLKYEEICKDSRS